MGWQQLACRSPRVRRNPHLRLRDCVARRGRPKCPGVDCGYTAGDGFGGNRGHRRRSAAVVSHSPPISSGDQAFLGCFHSRRCRCRVVPWVATQHPYGHGCTSYRRGGPGASSVNGASAGRRDGCVSRFGAGLSPVARPPAGCSRCVALDSRELRGMGIGHAHGLRRDRPRPAAYLLGRRTSDHSARPSPHRSSRRGSTWPGSGEACFTAELTGLTSRAAGCDGERGPRTCP
jgi:hypothetical protein